MLFVNYVLIIPLIILSFIYKYSDVVGYFVPTVNSLLFVYCFTI
jgi:hypothetical protein